MMQSGTTRLEARPGSRSSACTWAGRPPRALTTTSLILLSGDFFMYAARALALIMRQPSESLRRIPHGRGKDAPYQGWRLMAVCRSPPAYEDAEPLHSRVTRRSCSPANLSRPRYVRHCEDINAKQVLLLVSFNIWVQLGPPTSNSKTSGIPGLNGQNS